MKFARRSSLCFVKVELAALSGNLLDATIHLFSRFGGYG